MIVMGIDPGTATTGWGIVKKMQNANCKMQNYGTIKTEAKTEFPERLKKIYRELRKIIKKYKPNVVVIEELFFAKNVKTAISVGQARGVAILAAVQSGIEVREFTPLQIKQALVGYGRAEKFQVQKMVKALLGLKEIPKPDDAADALAVAICHINSAKLSKIQTQITTN